VTARDDYLAAGRDVTAEIDALIAHKEALIRDLAAQNAYLRAGASPGYLRLPPGTLSRPPKPRVEPLDVDRTESPLG
jgi:hypothetical protein